jgi:hypothetical protein
MNSYLIVIVYSTVQNNLFRNSSFNSRRIRCFVLLDNTSFQY